MMTSDFPTRGAARYALWMLVVPAVLASAGCDALPLAPIEGTSTSVLTGAALYVDPNTAARRQVEEWRSTRPADAAQIEKIAEQPQALWLGEWSGDVRAAADRIVSAAEAQGSLAVLVAYNVPERDCGGLSGGGGATPEAYRGWVSELAAGIGDRAAAVVLEPDALAAMDCLTAAERSARVDLLREAVRTLKSQTRAAVYLDAGHPRWHSAEEISDRLEDAGIEAADGFALNVSNFYTDEENVEYGQRVSALVGGKGFIIDSSRNGRGPPPDGEWCNPEGRALGRRPTTRTGKWRVDAYLWVKRPGESDGACNGAPPSGEWWPEYALELARRASY